VTAALQGRDRLPGEAYAGCQTAGLTPVKLRR
jgi:hypothetical protein